MQMHLQIISYCIEQGHGSVNLLFGQSTETKLTTFCPTNSASPVRCGDRANTLVMRRCSNTPTGAAFAVLVPSRVGAVPPHAPAPCESSLSGKLHTGETARGVGGHTESSRATPRIRHVECVEFAQPKTSTDFRLRLGGGANAPGGWGLSSDRGTALTTKTNDNNGVSNAISFCSWRRPLSRPRGGPPNRRPCAPTTAEAPLHNERPVLGGPTQPPEISHKPASFCVFLQFSLCRFPS